MVHIENSSAMQNEDRFSIVYHLPAGSELEAEKKK